MTATLAVRPPTEQEIRAAVEAAIVETAVLDDLAGKVYAAFYTAVWDGDDLRPSEQGALDALVEPVFDRVRAGCREVIVDELTAAGVQFAAEFPDAPRPESNGATP